MKGRIPIESAGTDEEVRRIDGRRRAFQGRGLSAEEVGFLLGELRDLLGSEAREAPRRNVLLKRLNGLLSSLERAPGAGEPKRRSVAALRSWSEVWVEELESGRKGDADSVRTLLLVELMRLGRILGEEA